MTGSFTKADLKNRMVVEYRCGWRRLVVDNVLMGDGLYGRLDGYTDDLLEKDQHSEYDIMKVYEQIHCIPIPFGCLELIWQREETKEVTMEDIEKKFGCKVKIVNE